MSDHPDPTCRYPSAQEAALAVRDAVKNDPGLPALWAAPFDVHHPQTSCWWLVPTSERTTYRFGKILFDADAAAPDRLLIGLYVEKGLSKEYARAVLRPDAARKQTMDERTWAWRPFVRSLRAGGLGAPCASMLAAGLPLEVRVDSAPGHDREDGPVPSDIYSLRLQADGSLQPRALSTAAGCIPSFARVRTWAELARAFDEYSENGQIWINAVFGASFARSPSPPPEAWSALRLAECLVLPFAPWLGDGTAIPRKR